MKIVFMDRDGVINRDRADYVKDWSEFEFLPGSLEALRRLTHSGYRIIIISNQSVINRGIMTPEGLARIHGRMTRAVVAYGGMIAGIYYCPHGPDDGCTCRKPKPGLIEQARADHGIDVSQACMIGDSLKDMDCARRAGCGKAVLVRTGHGQEAERLCRQRGIAPDHVAQDLLTAVEWLLAQEA